MLTGYLGLMAYFLLAPAPPSAGNDLVGHAAGFFVLALLVWWNLPAGPWREVLAWCVCIAFGGLTEGVQGMLAQRTMSVVDWAADVVGSGGVLVMGVLPGRRTTPSTRAR